MRLTLLVPELIWPEPADQLALGKLSAPGFEWLAARAKLTRQPRRAFELALAHQFALDEPPFGALRLLGESGEALRQKARAGHWLCADPVHLRFHQERIILADAGAFDLEEVEAEAIIASLNSEFADVGEFHLGTARRWYLRLHDAGREKLANAAVNRNFEPISAVAGRLVDSEHSDKKAPLTRWLNEVQMFLHGHPTNEQRQREGKPAINSLWLWGVGSLPGTTDAGETQNRGQTTVLPRGLSPVFSLSSNNPIAIGLANAAHLPLRPLPSDLAGLLADAVPDSEQLVVLDSLLPPVLYEDSEGWRRAFEALENNWFAPLRGPLGRRIERLDIIAPTIYGELGFSLTSKDRWKFWRKGRPLAALASELAEGKS